MALTRFGFIVTGTGLDPARHRQVMASGEFQMTTVGVATVDQALPVACDLVDSGVQLLELCGGFGPVGTARVLEAIGHRVPVGAVGYGPESIDAMAALFAPAG